MRGTRHPLRWLAALPVLATAASAQLPPSDQVEVSVNYVYAAQFGLGSYEVGGLQVDVYTLPIPYTWRDVYRDWDLHLRVPIVYGSYDFAATIEERGQLVHVSADTNSLAVAPRLRLDIPLPLDGLRLSPIAPWGVGATFDSSGRARAATIEVPLSTSESWFYTWEAGVSSLYQRHQRDLTGNLGMALLGAGDNTFEGDSVEAYGSFRAGVEGRHPLGFTIEGREPDGGLYVIYDHFFPSLQFSRVRRASLEVSNLVEVGATLGAASPLELPWVGDMLDDLQLGAAYQVGDGLDAWKLSTGFPF